MSEMRREFDKLKRRPGFYDPLGGKQHHREIHHKIQIRQGGTNEYSNLIYLPEWWHRYFHKMDIKVNWGTAKCPSLEKTVDLISQALLEQAQLEYNQACVEWGLNVR